MRFNLILVHFLLFSMALQAQSLVEKTVINKKEIALANQINDLREANGLQELSLSISLTYVAQTHVKDLERYHPDTSICSTASWSDHGEWTACCYNKYVVKEDCMWDKPKELTDYLFRGYEFSYYSEDIIISRDLLKIWGQSPEAIDMFLNRGVYQNLQWNTFGICIGKHYASIWFGQLPDHAGSPKDRKNK